MKNSKGVIYKKQKNQGRDINSILAYSELPTLKMCEQT